MKSLILYLSLALIILGCEKNTVEPTINHSSKYQPLALGYSWLYLADSIVFYSSQTQKPDTFQYLIKQQITDKFINNEGQEVFVISQSYTSYSNSKWTFSSTFTLHKDVNSLVRTFEDVTTVTLSFPFEVSKKWDGNQYNSKSKIECYYDLVHRALTAQTMQYDSTTVIMREQETNLVTSKFEKEVYAVNVGLISKHYEFVTGLDTINPNPKGNKITYTLIRFEKL
jgi:hypothetical protein